MYICKVTRAGLGIVAFSFGYNINILQTENRFRLKNISLSLVDVSFSGFEYRKSVWAVKRQVKFLSERSLKYRHMSGYISDL